MARNPQPERLEAIFQAVECNPGKRPGFLARLLGLHRSDVNRLLPALEERGYLLSEDERGRLYPYPQSENR